MNTVPNPPRTKPVKGVVLTGHPHYSYAPNIVVLVIALAGAVILALFQWWAVFAIWCAFGVFVAVMALGNLDWKWDRNHGYEEIHYN